MISKGELVGAKDYDFTDDVPEYRESNRMTYRSKNDERTRKKRPKPRSKGAPSGMHQRRNKRINW